MQHNNAHMYIWSSLLSRYTKKDSNEIYFIFFRALLCFLRILEVYMNFWNSKRKIKTENLRTVLGRLRSRACHCFGLAGPATQRGCGRRSVVTASTATAVAWPGRAGRRISGDEVGAVSTIVRQATRRARSRG
jgi:hypothetical protein